MKRKQKNQLSQACLLGLLFFVLVSIFIFQPREVRALTGDYNKAINGTLAASEWNNLVNDFVAKSGSRLDGYFSINTATSSTYALDINGALRATSIEGSYTGFLNAANISSGQFGANAGFGNFSFPGNVGIGTTNPGYTLDITGTSNVSSYSRAAYFVTPGQMIFGNNTGMYQSAQQLGKYSFGSITAQGAYPLSMHSGDVSRTDGYINFFTAGLERLRVEGTGNIGIGVTNPATKLDVFSNATAGNNLRLQTVVTGAEPSVTIDFWNQNLSSGGTSAKLEVKQSDYQNNAMIFSTESGNTVAERMRIHTNGYVGIGTTAPRNKLDIYGSSSINWSQNNGHALLTVGSINSSGSLFINMPSVDATRPAGLGVDGIYSGGPSTIQLTAYGSYSAATAYYGNLLFRTSKATTISDRMFISGDTGNVGIGTTNPTARLYVNGTSIFNDVATFTQPVVVGAPVLNTHAATKNYVDSQISSSTGAIAFWGGALGGNLWNLNSGNIGIGTTNPSQKLDISLGTGSVSNGVAIRQSSATGYTPVTLFDNRNSSSYVGQWGLYGSGVASPNTSNMFFYNTAGGGIGFYVGSGAVPANDLRMLINSSGNVGIGTTSPGISKLRIEHNAWTTYGLTLSNTYTGGRSWNLGDGLAAMGMFSIRDETAGQVRLTINGAGNVGIGTTTPGTKLTVVGSGNYSIDAGNYRVGNVATPVAALDAVNKSYLDSAINTSQTAFWNINGSNLYASSTSWNVGIGTTAPTQKLQVEGNVRIGANKLMLGGGTADSFIQHDGSGLITFFQSNWGGDFKFRAADSGGTAYDRLWIEGSSGNIGIGTTNPTARLYVNGTSIFNDVATFTQPVVVGAPVLNTHAATKNYVDSQISSSTGAIAFWGGSLAANVWSLNSGNVGIGTTNPGTPLAIQSTNHETLTLQRAASNVSWAVWEKFRLYNSSNAFVDYGYVGGGITTNTAGSHTGYLGFGVAQSGSLAEAMRLSSAGNLGIGTVNPNSRLHVYNTAANAEIDIQSLVGAGNHWGTYSNLSDNSYRIWGGSDYLTILRSGNVGIGTTAPGAYRLFVNGNTNVAGSVTASSFVGPLTGTINASNVSSGDFGASTGGGVYSFPSNLGVGTTNPLGLLHIYSTASSSQALFIANNGYVGIGKNNPGFRLDVQGDTYIQGSLYNWGNASIQTLALGYGAAYPAILTTQTANEDLIIDPAGVGNIIMQGNVGIGTTAPGAYRLKVAGDMAVTGTLQTQTGSDFAEEFSVTEDLSAGTVVVMSNEGHKSVKAASSAYDRTVVGIVSDNPSIIAGKVDSEKKVVVAMMGVVSVNVSNSNGHIYKGDLLTSADLAGYAMKASEFKPGTIIGKALEDLKGAKGQIKVLVNLQ